MWVVGHYETPCGGGDTFPTPVAVFEHVRSAASRGYDVLFEGIISQDDVVMTVGLKTASYRLLVILLDVPIDICIKSIRARRNERGDVRPLNPKNTVNRLKSLGRTVARLRDNAIEVRRLGREPALRCVLGALGWPE